MRGSITQELRFALGSRTLGRWPAGRWPALVHHVVRSNREEALGGTHAVPVPLGLERGIRGVAFGNFFEGLSGSNLRRSPACSSKVWDAAGTAKKATKGTKSCAFCGYFLCV